MASSLLSQPLLQRAQPRLLNQHSAFPAPQCRLLPSRHLRCRARLPCPLSFQVLTSRQKLARTRTRQSPSAPTRPRCGLTLIQGCLKILSVIAQLPSHLEVQYRDAMCCPHRALPPDWNFLFKTECSKVLPTLRLPPVGTVMHPPRQLKLYTTVGMQRKESLQLHCLKRELKEQSTHRLPSLTLGIMRYSFRRRKLAHCRQGSRLGARARVAATSAATATAASRL